MKYVFVFGASIVHGVGGEHGGWADILKLDMHRKLYGESGSGQTCHVYELGVPGSTAKDLLERFESELDVRVRGEQPKDISILIQVGTNDSKAVDKPTNYVSVPEAFAKTIHRLLRISKQYSDQIIGVGLVPVDEAKANPSRYRSYFFNSRIQLFEDAFAHAAVSEGVTFVPLLKSVPKNWNERYLYSDGIHPNDVGHEWIYKQVNPILLQQLPAQE